MRYCAPIVTCEKSSGCDWWLNLGFSLFQQPNYAPLSLPAIRSASSRSRKDLVLEVLLRMYLGIDGVAAVVAGFLHIFDGPNLADSIGWPADNPFQTEVGIANLALGLVGCGCFWLPSWFVPAALGRGVFVGGAGILHIVEAAAGNSHAGNAGAILYWDMVRFITMLPLALLFVRWRQQYAAAVAPPGPAPARSNS